MEKKIENNIFPSEVLDLVSFLASGYMNAHDVLFKALEFEEAEKIKNHIILKFPMLQGTKNQISLRNIGKREYRKENLSFAVDWLLKNVNIKDIPTLAKKRELKEGFGSEAWVNNQLKAFAREFDQDKFTPFPSVEYAFDCLMATTEELDMMGTIRFLQILNEKIEKELASIFRREG